jgi:hypothetical protein
MATPVAVLPPPPDQDEAQYNDDEELQVYDDPNDENDSEDDEDNHQASQRRPEQRGAVRTNGNNNASRILTHIKPTNLPLFLKEYPDWLQNVIRATPVFCGLLSLTSTNGLEVLGPEDLQTRR